MLYFVLCFSSVMFTLVFVYWVSRDYYYSSTADIKPKTE